jgi:hypothetical protein
MGFGPLYGDGLEWLNDAVGMIKGDKEIGFDHY